MRVVLALAGLAMVAAAVIVGTGGDEQPAAAGEIFLEAAAVPGRDPFTEPADPEPTTTASVAPTTAGASTTAVPEVVTQPTSGVVPPPGSPPYGGSGDDTVCDREALVTFLQAQPDRAAAWAGVLGVSTTDIATYVRALTPTVLLYDTRVTNHGFAGGAATPRQSVLQAGTAVLVDATGNPVVRCRCGNPLRPALPVAAPQLVGAPWPGFAPTAVVAVDQGATVSVTIQAPAGAAPSTTPSTTPSSTTSTTPSSTTTSTSVPEQSSVTTPSTTGGPTIADVEGLVAVLSECAGADGTVQVLDVAADPDLPGVLTVQVRVNGEDMLFTYEPTSGDVGEGDRASAELLAACGVV